MEINYSIYFCSFHILQSNRIKSLKTLGWVWDSHTIHHTKPSLTFPVHPVIQMWVWCGQVVLQEFTLLYRMSLREWNASSLALYKLFGCRYAASVSMTSMFFFGVCRYFPHMCMTPPSISMQWIKWNTCQKIRCMYQISINVIKAFIWWRISEPRK